MNQIEENKWDADQSIKIARKVKNIHKGQSYGQIFNFQNRMGRDVSSKLPQPPNIKFEKDGEGPRVSFNDVRQEAPDSDDDNVSDVSESLESSSELSVINVNDLNNKPYRIKATIDCQHWKFNNDFPDFK